MHIYFHILQGCKTGMYYLRTKAAAQAIQFTVDKKKLQQSSTTKSAEKSESKTEGDKQDNNMAAMACSLQNKDDCLMCGS